MLLIIDLLSNRKMLPIKTSMKHFHLIFFSHSNTRRGTKHLPSLNSIVTLDLPEKFKYTF